MDIPSATYLWQDNTIDSIYNIDQPGVYWIEASLNNCTFIDTLNVVNREIIFEMSNVFTPNGDGLNGLLIPIVSVNILSMKTIFYDRWGNEVFETNNPLVE